MGIKKLLILASIVLLLAAIPLTVYFSQQQQKTTTQAEKSTNLCFSTTAPVIATTGTPTPPTATPTPATAVAPICSSTTTRSVGDTFTVDVVINPGNNVISTVEMNILYDATKLGVDAGAFVPSGGFIALSEPVYSTGNIYANVQINIGGAGSVDIGPALTSTTKKIGTITFKVLPTAVAGTAAISFGDSVVFSSARTDGFEENVLNQKQPISITINGAPAATPTPIPVAVVAPTCSGLNVDRTTSGNAPFAITFTANGRDADGTINKVTFDFGDGPVQDVTQSGGVGTNSVSTQVSHTYNNPGVYTASVILTDNTGTLSIKSPACTQTITVAQKPNGGGGTGGTGATPGPAQPTAVPTTIPTPTTVATITMTPPGPGETILGLGAVGAILSVIGGVLFFAF